MMQLDEEDIPFEEDVLRHPYNLKSWWRYLEFKLGANPRVRFLIYERALKELPGSHQSKTHSRNDLSPLIDVFDGRELQAVVSLFKRKNCTSLWKRSRFT